MVTIEDDDAPEITHVEISSRPLDGTAYSAGEDISDAGGATWRDVRYHSGSGSRHLVFRCEMRPEDRDTDNITVSRAGVDDHGNPAHGFSGKTYAKGTDIQIDSRHPGVTSTARQGIDGRPYVQGVAVTSEPPDGWNAYRANQTIEITLAFNTDGVVEGDVLVGLFVGLVDLD